MAAWGVLKPKIPSLTVRDKVALTKTDLFVESNTVGRLFSQEFFGVKENAILLLESSLSLQAKLAIKSDSLECQSYLGSQVRFLRN